MNLLDALNWRYATKRMNGNKVPAEKIDNILEAARLSASSMGLQPYNILIIEKEAVKKQIHEAAFNQPQVLECSHLLVFASWTKITEKEVDAYISHIATTRGVSVESLEGFKQSLTGFVVNKTDAEKAEWAAKQAYIAFGTALVAAAVEKVDATPMEGFIPAKVDEILGLSEKGLRSVTLLALGYRDETNDFLVNQKKVRRTKDELILTVA